MTVATFSFSTRRGAIRLPKSEGLGMLIKKLGDAELKWSGKDWGSGEQVVVRTLVPRACSVEDGQLYHRNYIDYLTYCWGQHLGIVIEPNHIWYTLLCELATQVKNDPDTYRDIFTTSDEKETIVVRDAQGGFIMPLDKLIAEMRDYVPTDIDLFLPDFTTSTQRSRGASRAAFCDMASPYYDYMMLACNFTAIDVRGTEDDWSLMCENWKKLGKLFEPLGKWFRKCQGILDNCVANLADPEWWKQIYKNERCGSGGQVEVSGWFSDLMFEKCSFPKPENFPGHTSVVPYRRENWHNPSDITNWEMKHGLLFSRDEGDFVVPDFGFILYQKLDEPETVKPVLVPRDGYIHGIWQPGIEPPSFADARSDNQFV